MYNKVVEAVNCHSESIMYLVDAIDNLTNMVRTQAKRIEVLERIIAETEIDEVNLPNDYDGLC